LKRVYILFAAKHGLNEADRAMLSSLGEQAMASGGTAFTLQAVITKIDAVPLDKVKTTLAQMRKEIFELAPACLPPLVTHAENHPRLGIEELRASIVEACGIGRVKP
jgi:GTP-binding protein